MTAQFTISSPNRQSFAVTVAGRNEWALRNLLAAGPNGCVPIDNPAPRWSAYVFNLRELGIDIETISESHGGQYPGRHARYVLKSHVEAI